ncbi:hypothetical protein LA080_010974 [Diaporthe eres]|nr:hypothetical protein LA080_010974 [Diaporthe eres]
MGPATCKAGSGAEWIVTWMDDGWMDGKRPRGKAKQSKGNRNKVLKQKTMALRWGATSTRNDGRPIPQRLFYGTIAMTGGIEVISSAHRALINSLIRGDRHMGEEARWGGWFPKRCSKREERNREKKDGTTERSNKLLAGCIDPDLTG